MIQEKDKIRVLVVEDEKNLRLVLQKELARMNYHVSVVPDGPLALKMLSEDDFDVMILDMKLPTMDGLEILKEVRKAGWPTEVIIATGYATVETAINAMKLGAYDYVTKPYKIDEVSILIKNAYEKKALAKDNMFLTTRLQRKEKFPDIITDNAKMREILGVIEKIAKSDTTILITGESGTGKELVARAIHLNSPRCGAPFIDINCGAIQESLLESELFGHEKGAFTGADACKPGLFEMADRGTIFLDEIGDLGLLLQVKVLRVLETRSFFRVGGTKKININVRILAATNKDLGMEVNSGAFRKDLYYRINTINVHLPVLQERIEDIPRLAKYFLEEFGQHGKKAFSTEAMEKLQIYHWPGNVRELRNVVERVALLAPGDVITPTDLPHEIAASEEAKGPAEDVGDLGEAENISLRDKEKEQIRAVLESVEWHRGKASEILGISQKTLYRKIKQFELDAEKSLAC
ncbi:MAG: sigma-54-dependent Fis family transcriptional regulator [Acidobacteria bacterium]|nr:sigma-54-dependent Fis family transcriptional regulator [Acidobacteriota bacterium]